MVNLGKVSMATKASSPGSRLDPNPVSPKLPMGFNA